MKNSKWFLRLAPFWLVMLMLTMGAKAQSQGRELVYQANFDAPNALQDWAGDRKAASVDVGQQGGQSIKVEQPLASGIGSPKIILPLPIENLRGTRLLCKAQVKADNVAKPPAAYNGIKFMLHVVSPSSDSWLQQQNVYGTFDWKTLQFDARVPTHATKVELIIGLEETTGTAWFDNIAIEVVSRTPRRPAQPPTTGPRFKGHDLPRLRGVMVSPNLSEADLRALATWNVNHIRWQLTWGDKPTDEAGKNDLNRYNAWMESALAQLDSKLPLCEQLGIKVLVDMHTPPGIRNTNNECLLFKSKRFQENFLEWWDKIALRYKDRDLVWGYDLLNEPVEGANDEISWHALATQAAKRIRAIDAKRAIIVEPAPWASPAAMEYFTPIEVPGVVYSVHMYDPHSFTHQGVATNPMGLTYPGVIEGKQWDKEQLRQVLKPVLDFQKAYNVHIYIGEFSAIRWAPNESATAYLRDVTDLFEEYEWDWAYHAFREWHGWSVEHGSDKAVNTRSPVVTEREHNLRTWFAKNQKPKGSLDVAVPVPTTGSPSTAVAPLANAVVANNVIFQTGFDEANPLQAWEGVKPDYMTVGPGLRSPNSLQVNVPPRSTEANATVRFRLPTDALNRIRGARLQVEAMVKADNVAAPPKVYNGIKVMLHTVAPSGHNYAQQDNVFGTFDWKPIRFEVAVPPDATLAELVLGMEVTTGTVWFDDVKVSVLSAPAAVAPATTVPLVAPANQTLAKEPFVRWLAIGNSITAHGAKPDIQWTGEARGMAASTVANDYVHLLQAKLQMRNPKNASDLKITGRLGKLSGGTIEQINTVLEELRAWNPDLVTVQLGENDRLNEMGNAEFEKRYRTLVDNFLVSPKRPVILCTGVWQPSNENIAQYPVGSESRSKDEIIQAICREKGLIFVPVAPFATKSANYGVGGSAGVRWHPNDAGMQAYADALFAALPQ